MNPIEAHTHGVTPHAQGCVISLTAVPRSPANRVEIDTNGSIRIRITAPPVDGAANTRLLKYLAAILGVPVSTLSIMSGGQSRHKRILAKGVDNESVWKALARAADLRN